MFGSIHFDRPSKVAEEFDGFAAGCDAVFVEYPRDFELRNHAAGLVKNPLLMVGTALYFFLFVPFYALVVRRMRPMEVVVAERFGRTRDVPVHAVDRYPYQIVNDGHFG